MKLRHQDGKVIFAAAVKTIGELLAAAFYAKANLREANLRRAELRGARLRRVNLHGADLYGADLSCADLYGADLSCADLRSANLGYAELGEANLGGANLSGANLCGANLCGANLCGANLRGAYFAGANFRGALLSEKYQRRAKLNWSGHSLLAEILRQAAGDSLPRREVAGLILISQDWCWNDFLTIPHPARHWALRELAKWVQAGDVVPEVLQWLAAKQRKKNCPRAARKPKRK